MIGKGIRKEAAFPTAILGGRIFIDESVLMVSGRNNCINLIRVVQKKLSSIETYQKGR